MASPVRNVASRYLDSLPESSPARAPLAQANNFNIRPAKKGKAHKLDSPDLDDLARQMNIDTPAKTAGFPRARLDTPSATVSSFQTSPSPRLGTPTAGRTEPRKLADLNVPIEPLSASKTRTLADSKAYEYLCRIQAIKNWLQAVLGEPIPQTAPQLISHIQNGIYLAKLANILLPGKKPVYTQDARLEFRHTENINRFFRLLKYLDIPDVFHFELTDLYDAKDVPKVWFCLHAISYKINTLNPAYPPMENLVGALDFDAAEIRAASRSLLGHQLPNFSSADNVNVGSPGTSSYMNKALSVSPTKLPKPASRAASPGAKPRLPETENPFLEPASIIPDPASKFSLGGMRIPDLTVKSIDSKPALTASPKSSMPTLLSSVGQLSQYYTPELDLHMTNILKLQALCKGSILRYHMFVRKIMVKSYDTELTTFFSIIRGNMVRSKTVHRHRGDLLAYENDISRLQAIARLRMAQKRLNTVIDCAGGDSVRHLHHIARGFLVRHDIREKIHTLLRYEEQITGLQCRIRARPIYDRASTFLQHRSLIEPSIVQVQSLARRSLFIRLQNESVTSHLKHDDAIIELQGLARGAFVRSKVAKCLGVLSEQICSLGELQSIARGAITRTRLCNNVLITLIGEDVKMSELFAKARGNAVREDIRHKKFVLQIKEEDKIVSLQSGFRGILARFNQSVDMEDIYDNVDSIIRLQTTIRGKIVRLKRASFDHYYAIHADKVVKAQAILRSKYTKDAYKAFIMMKNPPLGVVRKFAYLLSDSGTDFEEEIELTRLKDEILERSKGNEDLEAQIENLDIKLSLLDKNKISIEEFMKHNKNFKTYKPLVHNAGARKNLDKLKKSVRKRIELYLSMFYFLQTNPAYWSRFYETMSPSDFNELLKNVHSLVAQLFSLPRITVNSHSREEFFFVKLVSALMKTDIERDSRNVADITKIKSTFWISFLLDFNNQTSQRTHLKRQFGKAVEKILDDDETTFEPNPSKIHELIRAREINVYGKSEKPREVSPQIAIQNHEVSSQFVKNLTDLRDATSDFMDILRRGIPSLPIHMRVLAKTAYKLSRAQFPEHNEQQYLSVAGVVIIKHYISNIMQCPANFGYSTRDPISSAGIYPEKGCDNLKYLSRVLLQVFSMKAFSDNFMKPLNDFVLSYVDSTMALIREIIDVRDLEVEYEMNDYDDLVVHDRPQLTMKVSDMIAIEKLVSRHLDIVVPGLDDQLYAILSELNDLVDSADDFVTLTEMGDFTLTLSPASQEASMADSKIKNLMAQAKRCLLYIIRVQDGDDLLELFVRGIKPNHETKFRQIIDTEISEASEAGRGSRGNSFPYSRSPLGDLSSVNYVTLKKMALKVILQLESLKVVTRKNSFQELLNQVVLDIKTKDSRRKSRKTQLLVASQTVSKLLEKEVFLRKQLNDYIKHIDKVLLDLQRRPKDKKIFNIIPVFSKQYFYHRQLKKNNRLPKFGSYKYSAKKLMDQGVVNNIGGTLYKRTASSSKVEFMFSCHKAGVFVIEAANGTVNIPGACNTITLDKVLDHQYEHKQLWVMFDGMVTFDTENLATLIFKHFYDIKNE
ncbi:ras GTPase-activating-like protein [Metschnikowia bicuspidata var. bicuspidata NRRL YB-4993]|uniref:Ras GTPase-activating-like protein n=1 Tax=Metschnikowia bicuspidata var. bicuspidata NRRL YB-4993 TaxID=869754 RepID=A0A1A0HDK4_9ASCO|nr:ras GTPase-activating-like protein [Metschnikowia bicuspidata var. bicuspidata NRRL YB-4993]OBA22096.1 ras GTPase-activating-like protein [Metschnikowia bicuspidata var. bicuspidata NRRL YB-4993]